MNGNTEVSLSCGGGEFPADWKKQLTFSERPTTVCVHWSGKNPAIWAQWHLYKVINGAPDEKILSGDVNAATLASPTSDFQIPLQPSLPQFNTGSHAQKYQVRITSKEQATGERLYSSLTAILVHLPKPAAANPFKCANGPTRKVVLDIPWMIVNRTTSTPGDGDRDELFFQIKWKKGGDGDVRRLPSADDYYEAKNMQNTKNGWTNKDETMVLHPILWSGTLKHGQKLQVEINAQEQDNSDLKDIKMGIVTAMSAVAAAGAATQTPQGGVVAAVAGGVGGLTQIFVPDTHGNDYIGYLTVLVTNQCGYIQTSWVTYESADTGTDAGVVHNKFETDDNLTGVESHLVVHDANNLFWPNGVDWTPYKRGGKPREPAILTTHFA